MTLRTKGEQKAYLDGFERCAECVEQYLSVKGKNILEGLLMAVRNAVEIEDVAESEGRNEQRNNQSDGRLMQGSSYQYP